MPDLIINVQMLLEDIKDRLDTILNKNSNVNREKQKVRPIKPIDQVPVNKEQTSSWLYNTRTKLIGGFGNLNTNTQTEIKQNGGQVY